MFSAVGISGLQPGEDAKIQQERHAPWALAESIGAGETAADRAVLHHASQLLMSDVYEICEEPLDLFADFFNDVDVYLGEIVGLHG
jgi:hypothetical protein